MPEQGHKQHVQISASSGPLFTIFATPTPSEFHLLFGPPKQTPDNKIKLESHPRLLVREVRWSREYGTVECCSWDNERCRSADRDRH